MSGEDAGRCAALLGGPGREEGEVSLLLALSGLFRSLARKEEFLLRYPRFPDLYQGYLERIEAGDAEGAEEGLTMTYAYLHGCDSDYTPGERNVLDARGGYWCHAGGLSPLERAGACILPETRSADYGAGNGLQGLLLQYLYPHRRTTLIELSGPMLKRGRALGAMMGIPGERVEWIHGSVETVSPRFFDFIYIYRPLRPEGAAGKAFYRWFAGELASVSHRVTIFSVADCLRDFLDGSRFTSFYDDGQLTCFSNGL